ncbi:hypothetical protein E4633_16450 [Geomonas terrae]|uniref:Uncharacterized protein n=1 Tax=Geomonas terrae TaxID=2562681 RepID=A0A4S1CBT0_9BACT|nr:hypothetical protein [Geomonas terrae]TGU70593.1 hypothetical protein E4633_16450 [Geomonas terrae]
MRQTRKKRVLLIPAYYYSSNPLFLAIKERLPEWEFVYFFSKDTAAKEINMENITSEKVGIHFDRYLELEYTPSWIRNRHRKQVMPLWKKMVTLRGVRYWFNLRRYTSCFKRQVRSLDVDLVVLPSDMTFSARLMRTYFPGIPRVVIQPNFLDFRDKGRPNRVLRALLNGVIGVPFFPSQPYFGLEDLQSHLLIWGDKTEKFYGGKRSKVQRITNPEHCSLLEQVAKARTERPFEAFSEFADLDPEKKTIILFVDSFAQVYGEVFQTRIEHDYVQIVNACLSQYNIVVKIHPSSDLSYYQRVFEPFLEARNFLLLKDNRCFHGLLAICDINVSTFSYAGFQAALVGSMSINLFPDVLPKDTNHDWLSDCCQCEATGHGDVISFVRSLEESEVKQRCMKKSSEFVEKYVTSASFNPQYWETLFSSFLHPV